MTLVDISLPIEPGMVFCEGDPTVQISPYLQMARGDAANVSLLSLGSHTGTHLDAPAHFLDGAPTVDELPLETLVGPTLLASVGAKELISQRDLELLPLQGHTRLLLKTRNSALWALGRFTRDYVALDLEGACYLVEQGIRLVGIDYLSLETYEAPGHPVHRLLLGAGVIILEGLNLTGVDSGVFELLCLPLPARGIDGAPCRAV
ncbi:MAG: cyclase family protein, partial [Anaerolineae bacterium]